MTVTNSCPTITLPIVAVEEEEEDTLADGEVTKA